MPSLPHNLSGEVITVARDISKSLVAFGNSRVLSTDDVLLGRGGGQYKAYEDLLKDGHCKSVIQKRQLAVIAREWQVEPASSSAQDKKAADMVSAQLKALATKVSADALGVGGFDSTCLNFLDATLKGFAVGETIWGFDGGEIYASEVKPRNQQIFSFGISTETEDYELRLLTLQDMVFGVPLVKDYPRKFIVHTFGSKDGNPLGVGLGQVLWWPVFFKKQGIKFWLQFVDKFAAPTAVAKYSKGATEKQKQEILAALEAIATDAGIALPEGVEIMLLEAARSGSIDTYERLCKYMDTEMSKATLGETLSTDIGERGSYGASKTHNEVRKELVKADADLLSDTLNRTLVRWIVELNLPSAKPPRVWRNFEEAEDLNTRVDRDKKLFDMGFRLKPEAVTEIYGDHYELMQKEEPQQASGKVGDEEFLKNSGVQSNESDESADMSETMDFGSIIDRVLKWNGLAIGVEFLPNQVRFPGRKHSKKLRSGYGHIRGTKSADGEALDCYIYPGLLKDEPEGSDRLFQISQISPEDGDFDEFKLMVGYSNLKAAKEAYLQEMPIEFFGGIQEVTLESLEQYKKSPISLSTSQSLPIAPNFAEEAKDTPELYAEQLQERTAPVISSWLEQVRSLVQKSESFEEVRDSLFDLFPQLNTADFTQVMAEAMMASEAAGRWEVVNESGVEFAEAVEGTKITDPKLLLELRDILESLYQDGVTSIPQASMLADESFTGIFKDKVATGLTKRFSFTITSDDEISYELLNPDDVENFVEPVDFAQKKAKNCTKGVACGGGCISANKTCRKNADPATKKKIAKVRQSLGEKQPKSKSKSSGGDGGFPSDPSKLEVVKSLGGSTGAVLVRDPATGKLFVKKTGDSPDHLRSEAAADDAYRALGVGVPKHKLYETPDGPVKLAEYVEGRSLKEVMENGTPAEKKKLLAEIKKHYVADALLGNWDVVGLEKDNVILGNDGKAYRVDNGGALGYRAQGAKKTDEQWNKYPKELWSMRDKDVNPQAAEIFAGMKHKDIVEQIDAITPAKQKKLLAAVPPETREILKGRIEEMGRVAQISKTLKDDDWSDEYTSTFTKHSVGIRAAGITDKLPTSLKGEDGDVTLRDEKGKEFDDLRGKNSTMKDLQKYVEENGGNYKVATTWMEEQAQSSWSGAAQAYKYHLAEQRGGSKDDYYWSEGADSAKETYKKYVKKAGGQAKYNETMAAYHAFNYELLTKADIPNKNPDGTITLLRTENKAVMDMYGHKVGDTDITMKRGVAESTSLVKPVEVFGSELTEQRVPPHRIVGVYFHERHPGKGGSALMGDDENEFVAILDKVPFKYTKGKRQSSSGEPSSDEIYNALFGNSAKTSKKAPKKSNPAPDFDDNFLDNLLFGN